MSASGSGLKHPFPIYQRVKDNVSTNPGQMPTYERRLGDNEVSYYLPSRASGVNDMYLHIGFRAPTGLITPARVATAWAITRLLHPLYACTIKMRPGMYDEARYSYTPPSSPSEAIAEARNNLTLCDPRNTTLDDLVEGHMNGPRRLKPDLTSEIFLIEHLPSSESSTQREYDFVLSMTHYVGDGIALHISMHTFLSMLGGINTRQQWNAKTRTEDELAKVLEEQWDGRWGGPRMPDYILPPCIEDRLPKSKNAFQKAARAIEFHSSEERYVGGHVFPRKNSKSRLCVNVNQTYAPEETAHILSMCKLHKATMLHALTVLCNFAWMKTTNSIAALKSKADPTLPMMMYTSINLRPYIAKPPISESEMYLALTYFNVMLPSFLPTSVDPKKIFWMRCQNVKKQTIKAARSPMLLHRAQVMNAERGIRARRFAKEDDEEAGIIPKSSVPTPRQQLKPPTRSSSGPAPPPSMALLGVSHMGNLDHVYQFASYPDLELTGVHSTTRKSPGGLLLFSYTFRGRLYLSLGWDKPALQEGVVEAFWDELLKGVNQFLLQGFKDGSKL